VLLLVINKLMEVIKMTKLEEEVQNTKERLSSKERLAAGIAGAGLATFGAQYALYALGVEDGLVRMLVGLPFGFTGAYTGLRCDRIIDYFQKKHDDQKK